MAFVPRPFLIAIGLLSPMFAWADHDRLSQEVYVWQRVWSEAVREAIPTAAPRVQRFVVLHAQVGWSNGQPNVVRVPVRFDLLREIERPVGLALRLGAFDGDFARDTATSSFLAELARSLVDHATSAGVEAAELQLDFDCAESKLDSYRALVAAVKERVAPVPVTITVLPVWLRQPAFAGLVAATDGFVLQVHSLERPAGPDAVLSLCDPEAARRWVAQAGGFRVPFRVALPTYGYVVGFDRDGRYLGLSAEGPARVWPDNAKLRTVRADAPAMATLVAEWTRQRPANLTGIIWYRLPTRDDTLNWRWETLSAILDGRIPSPSVRAGTRRPQPALREIELVNDGDADATLPVEVEVNWSDARLVAADALNGFTLESTVVGRVVLRSTPAAALQCLAAGERRVIGWLRLDKSQEVNIHVHSSMP